MLLRYYLSRIHFVQLERYLRSFYFYGIFRKLFLITFQECPLPGASTYPISPCGSQLWLVEVEGWKVPSYLPKIYYKQRKISSQNDTEFA